MIERFPERWDTYLIRVQNDDPNGEIGRTLRELTGTRPPQGLSGGQQQRIAV